jgi:DNA adenine methylase
MRYNGGKGAVAIEIAKIINSFKPDTYWEPFVGAANVIIKVKAAQRKASDLDLGMMVLLRAIREGWEPPTTISEEEYQEMRKSTNETDPLYAFVKYGCSFGGKPWGGYARDNSGRNYALNARNSLLKKAPHLQDVILHYGDYANLNLSADLIYCDPPYRNTTSCGASVKFDTDKFIEWARMKSKSSIVLVSEREMPDDWECIWEKPLKDGLGPRKLTERLYRYARL